MKGKVFETSVDQPKHLPTLGTIKQVLVSCETGKAVWPIDRTHSLVQSGFLGGSLKRRCRQYIVARIPVPSIVRTLYDLSNFVVILGDRVVV
jgi:hypothetical protein